jgi:hypothetical protein
MKLDERAASARTDLESRFADFADVELPTPARIRTVHRRRRALQAAVAVLVLALGITAVVGRVHHVDEHPVELTPPAAIKSLGDGPSSATLNITIANGRFEPARLEAKTGIVRVTVTNRAGENKLLFADDAVRFSGIGVSDPGETRSARAFFPSAGTYRYYDPLPGHTAQGVVVVTGDPKTVREAEADAENATPSG